MIAFIKFTVALVSGGLCILGATKYPALGHVMLWVTGVLSLMSAGVHIGENA